MWKGYYMQNEKQIELAFKDFKCPPEGGVISGLTTDGRIAKGRIEGDRKFAFTLEAANSETLYFEG